MNEPVALHGPDPELFDPVRFAKALQAEATPLTTFKSALAEAEQVLARRYATGHDITDLVHGRAWLIDQILVQAWHLQSWPNPADIALVAVGGYGRGELHPASDIDLLILVRDARGDRHKVPVSQFLTFLWDIGLEIGQSVRTPAQCRDEAERDITVATALMESRTLVGPSDLRADMERLTRADTIWPIKSFFKAKWDEQITRHQKVDDIDHALEPNVKTSPGGLRDIQTIAWVAKRHFGARNFQDLVNLGFLSPAEQATLDEGQRVLWTLRWGLHTLAGRREDRLLFDKQRELAALLGYQDDNANLAVEKLMQRYYQVVANLRTLNDVLLQHFDEAILRADESEHIEPINKRFQIRNGYIETRSAKVFHRSPYAMLELFVLMAQNPRIQGVRAATLRQLREHCTLIDEAYRHDIRNVSLFMELLRSPHQMALQLRRMARYGILGRYLPEFGQITGKMQHDLFHIYTVDAHTLQVVENMRRFLLPGAENNFPVAAHVARHLPKLELLYIAGLYHDIAKGRGGDHSTLGMADADAFCRRHHLSTWDARLVSWLVQNHLLMSMTAQRKDIADPDVIHEFALAVGDKLHLDYLYAMTVADICATNPKLWNAWRAALLRQLYLSTKRALRLGLENPMDRDERILDKQQSVLTKLRDHGWDDATIRELWRHAGDEYFVRESVSNIAWHTETILRHTDSGPLIDVKDTVDNSIEGGTQVFIYMPNMAFLFANSTAAFEKLNLNIQNARIFTTANDFCMDTYTVLESNGKPVGDHPDRIAQIKRVLREHLQEANAYVRPAGIRANRAIKSFSQHVEAEIRNSTGRPYSTLEINCPDQPGILASVGKFFADHGISLRDARITTLGERVEDLFYITDDQNRPITDPAQVHALETDIKQRLEQRFAT